MSTAAVFNFQLHSTQVETTPHVLLDTCLSMNNASEEINLLLQFGLIEPSKENSQSLTCHLIRNTDGTIRWIWPSHASSPRFLSFYSIGNWKSRVFAGAAHLAFSLGLGKLFKQGKQIIQGCSFTDLGKSNWAIFTGTTGPNRKAILNIGQGSNACFIKFPFSEIAKANLLKEQHALVQLSKTGASEYFKFPEPINNQNTNLFGQKALPIDKLHASKLPNDLNLEKFVSWQESTLSKEILPFQCKEISTTRFSESLLEKVDSLNRWCQQNSINITTANHGDFTPWNCKMSGDELYVFDWEMYQEKGLPLEDLFHFVYQQAILVDRISVHEIRERIAEMLQHRAVKEFLTRFQLNPLALELHYLQRICQYYLDVYSRQEKWHMQVNWLLQTWEESISLLMNMESGMLRSSVLKDFQKASQEFELALLKFNLNSLAELPENSDLDICTTKKTAKAISQFFQQHPSVAKVKRKNLFKMHQLEVTLLDGSRIDLDLIFRFRRKWIEYLHAFEVLNTRTISSNGLALASKEMNALYVERFYALNGSDVPEKHQHWVLSRVPTRSINSIVQEVFQLPVNRGLVAILNRIAYVREMISSMKQEKGFLVTFSGVDGAGKSTIIETVKHELEKTHRRRVVVIRHRPSILPIISAWKYGKKGAEERSVSTLPRQGKNSGKLSSLIRFVYYLSDYVFGQWWIHFRYVRKGVIVLYDRYYFDFINDSRRSNIALSPAFTERFYSLIRKPEFNFFLWAPPEVILKRKQELDQQTIEGLTTQYTQLFDRLQKRDSTSVYRCIENLEIGATVGLIMRNVTKKTHESTFYSNHSPEKP
jgi:thymidylate kinase